MTKEVSRTGQRPCVYRVYRRRSGWPALKTIGSLPRRRRPNPPVVHIGLRGRRGWPLGWGWKRSRLAPCDAVQGCIWQRLPHGSQCVGEADEMW